MKVLKYRNCKNKYKQLCCKCRSKLLIDYADLKWNSYAWGGEYTFKCPVCGIEQTLSKENEELRRCYASRAKEEKSERL